jgi:Fe-S-cluster containining protein
MRMARSYDFRLTAPLPGLWHAAAVTTRLDRVLDDLAQAAQGRRRLPVIQPGDAAAVCGHFHAQIDRGTEARAGAAAEAGHPVACRAGCHECCTNVPVVFAGEAVTIARWLLDPAQSAAREGFAARYPDWRQRLAGPLAAWAASAGAGDVDGARAALVEAWRLRVSCAFLADGRCTIYPVRPAICRTAHALDTAEHCRADTADGLRYLPFPPLDEFLERIRPVVFAMHAALRPDGGGALPVCDAVAGALQEAGAK